MDEWKKWKSVGHPCIRYDSHRAEIIDVRTGEVLSDSSISGPYQSMLDDEYLNLEKMSNYYKSRVIHRNDIGDAFCSVDWSKY